MAGRNLFPKNDGDIYYSDDANSSYYNGLLSTTGDFGNATITTSTTEIVPGNSDRKKVLIRNIGDNTVYIGNDSATITTGVALDSNVCIVLNTRDGIFGITSADTSDIRYLEVL